eukprot:UN00604
MCSLTVSNLPKGQLSALHRHTKLTVYSLSNHTVYTHQCLGWGKPTKALLRIAQVTNPQMV